jgi:hypothetical protein
VEAKALQPDDVQIVVRKDDLLTAWKAVEKLVVSLHNIGRHHAVSGERQELTIDQRRQLNEDLGRLLSPSMLRELARARQVLLDCLPPDETERLSEQGIQYWDPGNDDR